MMEPIEQTPAETGTESVENQGEATTPKMDDGAQPAAEPQGEEPADDASHQRRPPQGVQKRLDELTREKYEWRREAAYWRDLAIKEQGKPAGDNALQDRGATRTEGQAKPNPDTFENYNDYIEALTDWKTIDTLRRERERTAQEAAQMAAQSEEEGLQRIVDESMHRAREKHADFDEVVAGLDVMWSQAAIRALRETKDGALILYHLGRNSAEAARISKLSPEGQIREIGKLEMKLSTPPRPSEPRRITSTGEPPRTVSGAGVAERDPDRMSMDEYARWRMAQKG